MRDQGVQYQNEVRTKGKGHGLGPPQLYAFGGLLTALGARGQETGALNQQVVKTYLDQYISSCAYFGYAEEHHNLEQLT